MLLMKIFHKEVINLTGLCRFVILQFLSLACVGYERFSILIFPVAILSTRYILNVFPASYRTCSMCDTNVVIIIHEYVYSNIHCLR